MHGPWMKSLGRTAAEQRLIATVIQRIEDYWDVMTTQEKAAIGHITERAAKRYMDLEDAYYAETVKKEQDGQG